MLNEGFHVKTVEINEYFNITGNSKINIIDKRWLRQLRGTLVTPIRSVNGSSIKYVKVKI